MTPVYVFGLTTHAQSPFSVNGHRIEFIDVAGMQAAIERRAEPPSVSEAALRDQHDVVMHIFEQADDLLPVRFGAWIEEHELSDLLTTRRAKIEQALDLVRGRVQMTVRFAESASAAAVVHNLVAAELTSPGSPRASASLYHLIDRDRVDAYHSAIARFESPEVTVSGPWPAFAFASTTWP
jgi:gas vesicle protein GvpL/GvpF